MTMGPERVALMIALCYRTARFQSFSAESMTEIYFRVRPDSEKFRITESRIIEVELTEKAENGRANAELLRKMREVTGEKPGIVSGHSSRRKKLIFNQGEEKIRSKVSSYTNR